MKKGGCKRDTDKVAFLRSRRINDIVVEVRDSRYRGLNELQRPAETSGWFCSNLIQ